MLKHARIIIASSGALEEEIKRHQGLLEGSLSIGSGPNPAVGLLAPALGRFGKCYPGISIDINVDDWSKFSGRLMQEDFDFLLMVCSQLDTSRDFELIRLDRHPGFFFCRQGHPLLERDSLTISDLSQFPLIFTTLPKQLSDLLDRLFFPGGNPGASVRKLQKNSCNDLGTMKATVTHSDSLGLGTYGTVASELEAGLFVALPFRFPELQSLWDIAIKKGLSLSPAAKAFIEILTEIDKEQSLLETELIESLGPEITGSEHPADF